MHSGWRSSGRRLLAIGLGGLGGLGIALSISPAGVVDAIDPSVRTLRNLGFGGAVAFGIVQVLVAVSGVLPASPGGTPTAEPMVCRLPAGGNRIRTRGPTLRRAALPNTRHSDSESFGRRERHHFGGDQKLESASTAGEFL